MMPRSMSFRSLVDLGWLYGGKASTVVVALVALPWYQKLMGAETFGFVAVFLSIQAFLVLVDLGLTTVVHREIAYQQTTDHDYQTLRAATFVLQFLYAAILVLGVGCAALFSLEISLAELVSSIACFWAITSQNVAQSALTARRYFLVAGVNQTVGVLLRAAITIGAMIFVSPTIEVFLTAQAVTAVAHYLVTMWICVTVFGAKDHTSRISLTLAKSLVARGKPLVLFGIAGAAVLQLDKVILALFEPSERVAAYYLASVLCLTPISILAAPIAQYFQPQIIAAIGRGDSDESGRLLSQLTTMLIGIVGALSSILWVWRESLVHLWLGGAATAAEVSHYVGILLPGVALGALGYVPFTLLTAQQDYSFQALLSGILTIVTLTLVVAVASLGDIAAVCWLYVAYHVTSAVVSWGRAIRLQPSDRPRHATWTAQLAVKQLMVLAGMSVAVVLLRNIVS